MVKKKDLYYWFYENRKTAAIFFIIILILTTLGIIITNKSGEKYPDIDDRDIVDNKGAMNPITNININEEKPERHLTQEDRESIKEALPDDNEKLIHITCKLGDDESCNYAREIFSFILSINRTAEEWVAPMDFKGKGFQDGEDINEQAEKEIKDYLSGKLKKFSVVPHATKE